MTLASREQRHECAFLDSGRKPTRRSLKGRAPWSMHGGGRLTYRDRGLALARIWFDQEAIEQIRTVEDLAPTRIGSTLLVRDAVASMLSRAQREVGSPRAA
jgi:hypothetical protein